MSGSTFGIITLMLLMVYAEPFNSTVVLDIIKDPSKIVKSLGSFFFTAFHNMSPSIRYHRVFVLVIALTVLLARH